MSNSESRAPGILLHPGRDGPVRKRHHPWIYSQAVAEAVPGASPSRPLPVRAADGTAIGWGLYSPGSLISVRMLSFSAEPLLENWLEHRVASAVRLREELRIDSDAMRLVNAEGDFLPGLVVDRYADTAVICAHTRAMEDAVDRVADCLIELLPDIRVYLKRDEHFARVEKLGRAPGYLRGTGDGTSVIRESSVRLTVDCAQGQKTGYYLDQRENRGIVARSCSGRRLLNLFSYTGAVALRAAAAGALHATSVDSSSRALEIGQQNVSLTPGLAAQAFDWVQSDVFSYLENPAPCDVLVADPPPFARRRADLPTALKGYLGLFQQCLRILSPGGTAFLFSCSGAVDRQTFQQVVAEAALRAGRTARLLRELHADVDHPVAAPHPEGEYLKGWMVHVA